MHPRFSYLSKFISFECSFTRRMTSCNVVRSRVNTFSQLCRPSGRGFFHALRRISGDKSVVDVSLGRACDFFSFSSYGFWSIVLVRFKSIFLLEFKRDSVEVLPGKENKKEPRHDPCSSRKIINEFHLHYWLLIFFILYLHKFFSYFVS